MAVQLKGYTSPFEGVYVGSENVAPPKGLMVEREDGGAVLLRPVVIQARYVQPHEDQVALGQVISEP